MVPNGGEARQSIDNNLFHHTTQDAATTGHNREGIVRDPARNMFRTTNGTTHNTGQLKF
jgi:hypothetical protein